MEDPSSDYEYPHKTIPSQVKEMEDGIFNLTISLCQLLQTKMPPQAAMEYVAEYLNRIADGLTQVQTKEPTNDQPEE